MALSFGPLSIANQFGFWAFLCLIPFILLYLIRPKPVHMDIPSLMFFQRALHKSKSISFLRTFFKDLLFFLQLLILLLLSFSIAEPFLEYEVDVSAAHTVFVIDVSASSQVKEGSKTRFDITIEKASSLLTSKNTIVLAKGVPNVALKDADEQTAKAFLKNLKPLETSSRLGESIILAAETVGSGDGRIVVLSDFINTEGMPPTRAAGVVKSKGITIDFINVATENAKRNIGIVDLVADEESSIVYIKNFGEGPETVDLSVGDLQKSLTIQSNSIEQFSFTTPPGTTSISLTTNDDFSVDDTAFLVAPEKEKIKILYVSNDESLFVKTALVSSREAELTVAQPPIVPKTAFDVFVLHNIDPNELLPGTLEDMKEQVKNGASLFVLAQRNMPAIDYKGLLGVTLVGMERGATTRVEQVTQFTKDIEFGTIEEFYEVEAKEGVATIVSANEKPLITYHQLGGGKVLYFGIMEEHSDFKFSPSFPIFWTKLLAFVTEKRNIDNINYATGGALILPTVQTIKTPKSTVRKSTLLLEEAGIYELENYEIAANLLSEAESDISYKEEESSVGQKVKLSEITEVKSYGLEPIFLIIVCLLLFFELVYIKSRGDV